MTKRPEGRQRISLTSLIKTTQCKLTAVRQLVDRLIGLLVSCHFISKTITFSYDISYQL